MKIKKLVLLLNLVTILFLAASSDIFPQKKSSTPNSAYESITGLIERIAPGKSGNFVFETINNGKRTGNI